jgi:hypothetical protein
MSCNSFTLFLYPEMALATVNRANKSPLPGAAKAASPERGVGVAFE